MNKDIEKLPYFTLSQLSFYLKDKKTATVYIDNWLKSGKIHRIAKWTYISDKKLNEFSFGWKLNSFIEFVASNLVYTPSYISLDYVLFENSVLTENVYNITCVSTKKTASFKYSLWNFTYKSIKKDLFGDWEIIKKDWFWVYKASLEKALFDWFYFKRGIVWDIDYFDSLRLNLENLDLEKFEKIVDKYESKKLKKVLLYIKKMKW